MDQSFTALPQLPAEQESERQNRERYHTSLYLTRQDVAWLDALAAMYLTNRSAVARLVLAEARRQFSQKTRDAENEYTELGDLPVPTPPPNLPIPLVGDPLEQIAALAQGIRIKATPLPVLYLEGSTVGDTF